MPEPFSNVCAVCNRPIVELDNVDVFVDPSWLGEHSVPGRPHSDADDDVIAEGLYGWIHSGCFARRKHAQHWQSRIEGLHIALGAVSKRQDGRSAVLFENLDEVLLFDGPGKMIRLPVQGFLSATRLGDRWYVRGSTRVRILQPRSKTYVELIKRLAIPSEPVLLRTVTASLGIEELYPSTLISDDSAISAFDDVPKTERWKLVAEGELRGECRYGVCVSSEGLELVRRMNVESN